MSNLEEKESKLQIVESQEHTEIKVRTYFVNWFDNCFIIRNIDKIFIILWQNGEFYLLLFELI